MRLYWPARFLCPRVFNTVPSTEDPRCQSETVTYDYYEHMNLVFTSCWMYLRFYLCFPYSFFYALIAWLRENVYQNVFKSNKYHSKPFWLVLVTSFLLSLQLQNIWLECFLDCHLHDDFFESNLTLFNYLCKTKTYSEAALQRCSRKKILWKYAAIYRRAAMPKCKATLFKSPFGMGVLL